MKLLEKARDKEFWKYVRESESFKAHRDDLLKMYNSYAVNDLPAVKYSEFKMFWGSGNRSVYEKSYFSRRQALNAAAFMSLIYPENEEYLNKLMDIIFAICDEYTWCLPAHQHVLDKSNKCVIDLFASETGFALSEIYTMLEDRLDPLIKDRIKKEIEYRIITPFTSVEKYSWWENGTNNWTAVCTGSVACTAMLMFPDTARELIPRFMKSIEFFLSGFSDDGICFEGFGYWIYGFGFFTVFADMIKTFTDGKVDYFKDERVKTIATYLQKMYLYENVQISFADAINNSKYQLGLQHYLKDTYPSDVLVYDFKLSELTDNCARFCHHLRSFTWFNEKYFYSPDPISKNDTYYAKDAQWFIKKTPNYALAAKGGNNDEPHNHNDVGTFIFAKNNRQVIADLGRGTYCRQYFRADTRYDFLETSSKGHNVPIVNGKFQSEGKEFRCKRAEYENNTLTLDISGAYDCDELTELTRRFDCSEEFVSVSDSYKCKGDLKIVERLVTYDEPKHTGDGKIVISDATLVYSCATVDSVVILPEKTSEGKDCYLISFILKEGVTHFSFSII